MGGKYKSIQDQIWAKPIFRSFETILLQTCASFSFSKTSSILDLSERHSGSCLSSVAKSKCQYQWLGSVLWRLMAVIFLQMIIFLELVTNYRPDEMCIAQDPLDKNWLIAIGRGAQQVVPQLVGYVHLNESLFVLRHEFRHTRPLLCHFTGLGSWLFKQILVSQHEGPSLKVPTAGGLFSKGWYIITPVDCKMCLYVSELSFICKRECVGFGTQLMCNHLVSIQSLTVKTKLPT